MYTMIIIRKLLSCHHTLQVYRYFRAL